MLESHTAQGAQKMTPLSGCLISHPIDYPTSTFREVDLSMTDQGALS